MLDPPLVVELVYDSDSTKESTMYRSNEKMGIASILSNVMVQQPPCTNSLGMDEDTAPEEYICNITLHSDGPDLASTIAKPKAYQTSPYSKGKEMKERSYAQRYSNMIGKTTCCGQILHDHMAQTGVFFVFPDLSIRIAGWYSIEATVIHIPTYYEFIRMRTIGQVTTPRTFEVFPSKLFPGMQRIFRLTLAITPLSKALARQGVPIRNRRQGTNNIFRKED
jgi:hypothetical protein